MFMLILFVSVAIGYIDTCSNYVVTALLRGNRTLFSVSTLYSTKPHCKCGGDRALLNSAAIDGTYGGGWSSSSLDKKQYLQIDMVAPRKVTGVVTQGRTSEVYNQWVSKFRVLYSTDCKTWEYVGGKNGHEFDGNNDQSTLNENYFVNPVVAKCIRINPTSWQDHISMRADVIGCSLPSDCA